MVWRLLGPPWGCGGDTWTWGRNLSGAYCLKYREDIAHVQTKVMGIKAGTNYMDVESIKCNS